MQFPVFESEKQDGLADLINNNVVAYRSVASKTEAFKLPKAVELAKASNPDQVSDGMPTMTFLIQQICGTPELHQLTNNSIICTTSLISSDTSPHRK